MAKSMWARWYEYARDYPEQAFVPKRVSDEDTAMEAWLMACKEPEWPGMVLIHVWRVAAAAMSIPCLQPPPYLMYPSLEAARAALPLSACLLEGFPLVQRYCEAWLL